MRLVVANAFSLSMLSELIEASETKSIAVVVEEISLEEAKEYIKIFRERGDEIYSVVGHESTAKLLTKLLGTEIRYNRERYSLREGENLLVCQLLVRLPVGRELTEEELEMLLKNRQIRFYYICAIVKDPWR